MGNPSNMLDQIELKVRRLALKLDQLKTSNQQLLEENKLLKTALKKEDSKRTTLEQQLKRTQMALSSKQNDAPESTQKIRKELDQYIKEIDKCIEWLQDEA